MSDYWKKLKDPRWQRKRLEIMERDEFCCVFCGDKNSTLNVHHKNYRKGAEPWEYDDENFMTLCEDCHEYIHISIQEIKSNIVIYEQCEILTAISYYKNFYYLEHIDTLRSVLDQNLFSRDQNITNARIKKAENLITELQRIVDEVKNKVLRDPFDELDNMIEEYKTEGTKECNRLNDEAK